MSDLPGQRWTDGPLRAAHPVPDSPPDAPESSLEPAAPKSGDNSSWVIVLGLAVIVFLVGAIIVVLIDNNEDDKEGDGDVSATGDTDTTASADSTVSTGTEPDTPADGTTAGSPEDAVIMFFDAVTTGDCATAVDLASESMVAEEGGYQAVIDDCESMEQSTSTGFTVDDVSLIEESGDTASVELTVTFDLQGSTIPQTLIAELVLEGGGWKISGLPGGTPE